MPGTHREIWCIGDTGDINVPSHTRLPPEGSRRLQSVSRSGGRHMLTSEPAPPQGDEVITKVHDVMVAK